MFYSIRLILILFLTLFLRNAKCGEQPSIVIIGAGAAGIAAATRLLKNNFTNIKILEAENRLGGRINSVKFGDAFVDLGAQWCNGEENNIVYSIVKHVNILRHSKYKNAVIKSHGKNVSDKFSDDLFQFMNSVYKAKEMDPSLENKCKKENSVGKCFKSLFNSSFVSKIKDEDELKTALAGLNFIQGYVSMWEGSADWDDVALLGSDYEVCKGDLFLNWNGFGYKTVLEILMQKYPPGQQPLPIDDKFILNKEVVSVSNWDTKEKATEVSCQNGDTFAAEHVIFTPSLGVLKGNYDTFFKPALPPEKVNAINSIGFGTVAKVMLRFPDKWWNDDLNWLVLWTADDVLNLKNDFEDGVTKNGKPWLTYLLNVSPADNNPKVLIAWYSADIFPELEELSDEVVLKGHTYFLQRFLGHTYNITAPDKVLRSKWFTNGHFRGTYSYELAESHPAGSTNKLQDKLAAPLLSVDGKLSVQFAGEATSPTHFASVHGAIETGFREADKIIDLYKRSSKL